MYAEQTAVSTDRLNVFEGGGSPRIHAGEGALQRSGERISTLIMRFSAGAFIHLDLNSGWSYSSFSQILC
jgi:hypothetical protein